MSVSTKSTTLWKRKTRLTSVRHTLILTSLDKRELILFFTRHLFLFALNNRAEYCTKCNTGTTSKRNDNFMKKCAVINDISGFGKCSLTASIPVMTASRESGAMSTFRRRMLPLWRPPRIFPRGNQCLSAL